MMACFTVTVLNRLDTSDVDDDDDDESDINNIMCDLVTATWFIVSRSLSLIHDLLFLPISTIESRVS